MINSPWDKHLQQKPKSWQNPLRVFFITACLIMLMLVGFCVQEVRPEVDPFDGFGKPKQEQAERFYVMKVKNSTATSFTIIIKIKNKDKHNIRLHQTVGSGEQSVPIKLRRDVEYKLYGWCNVCQTNIKLYFVNQPLLVLTRHNCTDFRGNKKQPRRWGT